jgi:hypothetical protein
LSDADHPQVFVFWIGPKEPELRDVDTQVPAEFSRGDATADGRRDLSDGVFILNHLFLGTDAPTCLASADTDDSGVLDLTDGSYLFNHLFLGGRRHRLLSPVVGRIRRLMR